MQLSEVVKVLPDISVREALYTLGREDPYLWTVIHRRLRGKPLFYDVLHLFPKEGKIPVHLFLLHRPFMIQPLTDNHPHKCYKKGRQMGVSELAINEVLGFLDSHPGTKWVYCVPESALIKTKRGWLKYEELQKSDWVLVLDPFEGYMKTRWERPISVEKFSFEGILSAVGPFHCTHEHRWPVRSINNNTISIIPTLEVDPKIHRLCTLGNDCSYPGDSNLREYSGIVWCPHTPSGNWYVRDNGYEAFTGNTFPRDSQLKDFSTTRINEALEETPLMKKLIGIPNQVYTKKIGESYLILRSAWESGLGEGIDADGVTLDEKDRMKDGVEIAFRESLSSSKYKHLREISTPTLPGRGIDASYQNSCQYEWFVKCTKCGMKQPVHYPENILQVKDVAVGAKQLESDSYIFACSKDDCHGELDRLQGEWVAKFPSKSLIAGYHMPQTIAPWISATTLMQKKIEYRLLQPFLNYCIGECSVGERLLLTEEDFMKCIAGHSWSLNRGSQWARVVAGVDWGGTNWGLVIGLNAHNNLRYLIGLVYFNDDDADPLGSAKRMAEYLKAFEPDLIVADAGYGKDRNSYLMKLFPNKIYCCYYNPSEKHSRTFKPQFIDATSRVLADRTVALKNACQVIKDRDIGLPVYDNLLRLFISHFRALAPIVIEEDGQMYEIIDKTGDDHLAHCMAYATMAMDNITMGWGSFACSWDETI